MPGIHHEALVGVKRVKSIISGSLALILTVSAMWGDVEWGSSCGEGEGKGWVLVNVYARRLDWIGGQVTYNFKLASGKVRGDFLKRNYHC